MNAEQKLQLAILESTQTFIIDLKKDWLSMNPKCRKDFAEFCIVEIQKVKDKI